MKEYAFRITVLVLLGFIGFAIYLHAENGRYQFIKTDANEIVLDTRTGEYWGVGAGGTVAHINARRGTMEIGSSVVNGRKLP